MKISSNISILLLMVLVSATSIALHRIGAFNTYFDVLSPEHNFIYVTNSNKNADSNLKFSNKTLSVQCTIGNSAEYQFCGVTIKLHDNSPTGMDLGIYKNILIDIDYKSPIENGPVRLLFRNFNPNYSTLGVPQSLKYNTIQFIPDELDKDMPLSTRSFQVASWWIEERYISYEDAQLDISNVTLVEVVTGAAKVPGKYSIRINSFVLQGNLFSEYTLVKILLLLWFAVSIYLVNRERSILKFISNQDTLTKIMNRRGLNNWLEKYFTSSGKDNSLAMFYIDIDDFKNINDSYGHVFGDHLLCEFCKTIQFELSRTPLKNVVKNPILARLSGDEFSLVVANADDAAINDIANKLLARFTDTITVDGIELYVNASIGIAKISESVKSPAELMGNADAAMYHSKNSGKNQYKIFDSEVAEKARYRKNISSSLRGAIEKNLFYLLYMPIYSGDSHRIRGAEVLIRSTATELENMSPSEFIPIAEEYGLIREIDLWVIESTFKTIGENAERFEGSDTLFCINISALELVNKVFPRQLKRLLEKYRINPKWIELELTETSLIYVDDLSVNVLHELTRIGVTLSLDDFGTGYTAFSQLLNYPVNRLKIDRSFVNNLTSDNSNDSRMVDVILAIARAYDLSVVAEGVETEYQYEYLSKNHCEYMQGHLMSRPIMWSEFLNLLDEQSNGEGHE